MAGLTVAIALVRMAQGGHFLSDVVFAMMRTWLVAWLVHSVMFRWIPNAVAARTRGASPQTSAS